MPEQNQIIICPACGAPSHPKAGKTNMPCAYCGTMLTIPKALLLKEVSSQTVPPKKTKFQQSEIVPSDLLRKAQPIALRAFNLYVLWTWVRRFLPACLTIMIVLIILCLALGALPVILKLIQ